MSKKKVFPEDFNGKRSAANEDELIEENIGNTGDDDEEIEKHLDEEEKNYCMISYVKWVPRGVFAVVPTKEAENLLDVAKIQTLGNVEASRKSSKNKKNEYDDDAELEEYEFDKYDDDDVDELIDQDNVEHDSSEDGDKKEGGFEKFHGTFLAMLAQDQLLEQEEKVKSDDSSLEDFEMSPEDLQVVSIQNEDSLSTLQVWVYEAPESNIFLHHDYLLKSYGISLDWLRLNGQGNFCAVGTFDKEIEVWNLDIVDATKATVVLGKKRQGHNGAVLSIAWNRKFAHFLASGGEDSLIKIWDMTSQQCSLTLNLHKDKIQRVLWHPEEANILLTASVDGSCCLLDPSKPNKFNRYTINNHKDNNNSSSSSNVEGDSIEQIQWDPHRKNQYVVATEKGRIIVFDYRKIDVPVLQWRAHDCECTDFVFHPKNENLLISGASNGSLKFWDLQSQSCLATKSLGHGSIYSLDCMEDYLAVGGRSISVEVFPLSKFNFQQQ